MGPLNVKYNIKSRENVVMKFSDGDSAFQMNTDLESLKRLHEELGKAIESFEQL